MLIFYRKESSFKVRSTRLERRDFPHQNELERLQSSDYLPSCALQSLLCLLCTCQYRIGSTNDVMHPIYEIISQHLTRTLKRYGLCIAQSMPIRLDASPRIPSGLVFVHSPSGTGNLDYGTSEIYTVFGTPSCFVLDCCSAVGLLLAQWH